jgi:hypothetical protein
MLYFTKVICRMSISNEVHMLTHVHAVCALMWLAGLGLLDTYIHVRSCRELAQTRD